MIAFIEGTLHKKNENNIFINVSGVGYKVFMPIRISAGFPESSEIFVYTYHRIGEGINDLYGFSDEKDLQFFELLLSVSGVGPKVGLAILEFPSIQIHQSILDEDIAFLTRVPGLGKKTASRLILELKGKLPENIESAGTKNTPAPKKYADVQIALEGLGFPKDRVKELFTRVPKNLTDAGDEELIRWGLKEL